jgi:hypothetical protein
VNDDEASTDAASTTRLTGRRDEIGIMRTPW